MALFRITFTFIFYLWLTHRVHGQISNWYDNVWYLQIIVNASSREIAVHFFERVNIQIQAVKVRVRLVLSWV